MDLIQAFFITSGRKDLAQDYFLKLATNPWERIKHEYGVDLTKIISLTDFAKINKILFKEGTQFILSQFHIGEILRKIAFILLRNDTTPSPIVLATHVESKNNRLEHRISINKYFDLVGQDSPIFHHMLNQENATDCHLIILVPTLRFIDFIEQFQDNRL